MSRSIIKTLLLIIAVLVLVSCSKPETKKTSDYPFLLAQYLSNNKLEQAKTIIARVRLTENSQNLIKLYFIIQQQGELSLNKEVAYVQQFYPQMGFVHKSMFMQIKKWLYLKQIYRQEVSPPVRILQRDSLYLAPSNIDFNKCDTARTYCANEVRAKLLEVISSQELTKSLKSMAIKDPCVNLASTLKGEAEANRCLKSSKGNLRIEILPKPLFSTNEWLQVVRDE